MMPTTAAAEKNDAATVADQTSSEFLGRWNRLISTTNWEKGRIIHDWRTALIAAGAEVEEYSDEAWAARVGQVSGQHVGRLRRAYERFGATHDDYPHLFWSHFQAALEWNDAEMWLEGAVHNSWSVAAMRRQRAEALGQLEADQAAGETVAADYDEDVDPANNSTKDLLKTHSDFDDRAGGPAAEGPDFGDEGESSSATATVDHDSDAADEGEPAVPNNARAFAELPSLPEDLSTVFEDLKLAVLRHKVTNWQAVQPSEIRAHLDAIQTLLG
jgi:hypothetical protein